MTVESLEALYDLIKNDTNDLYEADWVRTTIKDLVGDKNYIWIKPSIQTNSDVEDFISSWWHRYDESKIEPKMIIKKHICQILSDLDSNVTSIVHFNKKDMEDYAKKIQTNQEKLKNWFFLLHCHDLGLAQQSHDKEMLK